MGLAEKIKQKIDEGLQEGLQQLNKAIVEYDTLYRQALRSIATELMLEEYKEKSEGGEKMPADIAAIFDEVLIEKRKKAEAVFGKRSLTVEVLLNQGKEVEVVVPVKSKGHVSKLESDILNHVLQAFYAAGNQVHVGRLGDYASVKTDKVMNGLVSKIQSMPAPMALSNVHIEVVPAILPLHPDYDILAERSVVINLTPSAIKYSLIPLRMKHKDFFPDYKNDFELVTPIGKTLDVHVTSKIQGKRGEGNYIVGNLNQVFRQMNIGAEDSVEIVEIVPKKKYAMRKAGYR